MIELTAEMTQEQLNAICAELLIPPSSEVRTECKVTFKVFVPPSESAEENAK